KSTSSTHLKMRTDLWDGAWKCISPPPRYRILLKEVGPSPQVRIRLRPRRPPPRPPKHERRDLRGLCGQGNHRGKQDTERRPFCKPGRGKTDRIQTSAAHHYWRERGADRFQLAQDLDTRRHPRRDPAHSKTTASCPRSN